MGADLGALQAAAARLVAAETGRQPCPPVRELAPGAGADDGYTVQRLVASLTDPSGQRRVVGRKIGLTNPVVQRQMGVDRPDFGTLYADMAYSDNQPVPYASLLQPRIEAEIAFVLGRDLPERPVILSDVLGATDYVVAAIEIVDSRIRDWDISIFDTVADNASSGAFVLGGRPRSLRDVDDLRDVAMTLTAGDDEIASGSGAACLGHPAHAVVWLANAMNAQGSPLRAGDVILSGSLGPLVPAKPATTYRAAFSGLGAVHAVFTA